MKDELEMKQKQLYKELLSKGFDREYCLILVTRYLNTEYTISRMLGYLSRVQDISIEECTDEMLAILSDRDAWVKKKQTEHAQQKINEFYAGRCEEDDEEAYAPKEQFFNEENA